MRNSLKISTLILAFFLIGSCAKEEIAPEVQVEDVRKSAESEVVTKGEGDGNGYDQSDEGNEDVEDGEIRDPDNDFD